MFKNKILIVLITIVLCAIIILLAHLQFFHSRQNTIKLYSEKQSVLAKQVALTIEKFFWERVRELELVARNITDYNREVDKYIIEFKDVYEKIGSYQYLMFIDTTMEVLSVYPNNDIFDFSKILSHNKKILNIYKISAVRQKATICDHAIIDSDQNIICIRVPVYDRQDRFKGLLLGITEVDSSLNSIISPVIEQPEVHTFIISSKGYVLYHTTHPEMIRNNILNYKGGCQKCHENFELEKRMISEESGWGVKREEVGGKKLVSFARIKLPGIDWSVGIDMPYRVITGSDSRQFQIFFLLSASMILVVILVNIALYRIKKFEKETAFFKAKAKLLEDVEEAEAKYRFLVEQSPDAIAVFQKNKFVFANEKFLNLFGYTLDELNEETFSFYNLVIPQIVNHLKKELYEFLKEKKKLTMLSVRGISRSERVLDLEISITRFLLSGKIAYQVVVHDVTEMKLKEKENNQREHLAFIGEMSTRIAHEIKNPLASLQAGIQLLESNLPDDRETHEYFQRLTGEVQRVDRIVKGLLSYARQEQLNIQETDLAILIKRVINFIKQGTKDKKVEWLVDVKGENTIIHIDAQKIEQVLWNLILNSVQAIKKEGKIKITIHDNSVEAIQLIIADTGTGMSQSTMDKLFRPFFSTKSQGSGLGLAISKKIITAHEGRINIISKINQGTKVYLTLPR